MSGPVQYERASFVFDVDHVPVDAPPVLFHTIRVPCACGDRLTHCAYTFFDSAVFVRGRCVTCGDQTAIFAPPAEQIDRVGDSEESHDAHAAA